jgi:hypothetical protein
VGGMEYPVGGMEYPVGGMEYPVGGLGVSGGWFRSIRWVV